MNDIANGSQLKNPDISCVISTLSLILLILISQLMRGCQICQVSLIDPDYILVRRVDQNEDASVSSKMEVL